MADDLRGHRDGGDRQPARGASARRGLVELGCEFAIDDFGAGFGSFAYLKHLPSQYVKIDGDFIRRLPTSPNDQLVVQAIAKIAAGMGKRTIAEFVENEETLELLEEYGIDFAQGYFLGRPGPIEEVLAAKRRRSGASARRASSGTSTWRSSSGWRWSTWSVVWSRPKRSWSSCSSSSRTAWQSASASTVTWAENAGKPDVTSQRWRSWTSWTPGTRRQRAADLVGVEALRRRLEEDAAGLAKQPVGGVEHDRGDHQRGDAVGLVEAGGDDHQAGDRREDEGGEVGEDVLVGALDVHRLAVRRGEDPDARSG